MDNQFAAEQLLIQRKSYWKETWKIACRGEKTNKSPNDKSPDDHFLSGKYLSLQEDVAYRLLCLEQHNMALKHLFS